MRLNSLWLTATALACSMGAAMAQVPGDGPTTTSPTGSSPPNIAAFAKAANLPAGTVTNGSSRSATAPSAGISAGWNYAHGTNCGWFFDGTNQWYYIFPWEGGIVYEVNNVYAGQGLQTACVEGNYFAWYVTNTSTGAYTQTYSYPFNRSSPYTPY
jgi:hypothetical protein